MKHKKAAAITAGIFSGACFAGSFGLMHYIMDKKGQTPSESLAWQRAHYDTRFFKALDRSTFYAKCWDGYRLRALLCRDMKRNADSKKYVILSHGYNDTMFGCLKYMQMYLDLGYHCIIYDLRGWGSNERTYCTFGIRESRDLVCLIDECRKQFGTDIVLGLHGESMGASVSVFSLKYQQLVDFVVSDCGYADLTGVLKRLAPKKLHMPGFIVYPVSAAALICYGCSFRQMKPIDSLSQNKVPILFLHGSRDEYVIPENSWRMYEATEGYSEFHLIPGAGHAGSVLTDPDRYRQLVELFLKKINR